MLIGRTLAGAGPLGTSPPASAEPLRVWASGYGGAGSLSGNGNSHDADFALGGVIGGFEYNVLPGFRAGVALGYGRSGYSLSGLSGNADLNQYTVAVYASFARDAFYADVAVGYAYTDANVTRDIAFPGVVRSATGKPHSNAAIGRAEVGYHVRLGPSTALTPIAGLQVVSAMQGAFTESGAGAIDLRLGSQTTASVQGLLGAELTQSFVLGTGALQAALRLAWGHDFADVDRDIDASFAGLPSAAFTVEGVRAPRDVAVIGVGLSVPVETMQLFLRYDGSVAANYGVHSGTLGLRVAF
jgi:uncharacterized protein with beta-barrel porin domain